MYRADADVASDYFVADLPAGHYQLAAFRVERAMVGGAWTTNDWFLDVQPGRATYVGSIRFICLAEVWAAPGQEGGPRVAVGVVREADAARVALAPTFPKAGELLDGSEALSRAAALPRRSGFDYELFLRDDASAAGAPGELLTTVRGLVQNPKPPGSQRTTNEWEYRLTSGEWEAFYLLDEGARFVIVTKVRKIGSERIGPRGGAIE